MLTLVMLGWVGWNFDAPDWYWVCWGVCFLISIIKFGLAMFKAGAGE